jgi:peptidoglycan/LPS O-acetylase OafA/YrhL
VIQLLNKIGLNVEYDQNRIFGLDIVRAYAISIVLITHSVYFLPSWAISIVNLISMDGVSFFFVLSGFLIGGILIKTIESEGSTFKSLANFWLKRWFRTVPNYFLVFSVVYLFYSDFGRILIPSLKRYYIFSQNIYTVHPGYFIEAWSLSVEEWFYLSIPVFIFLMLNIFRANLKTAVLVACITIIIFSTGFRVYRFLNLENYSPESFEMLFRMQVITRLDSLVYGVIGAYLYRYFHEKWTLYKIHLLIFGCIGLLVNKYIHVNTNPGLYFFVFNLSVNAIMILCLLPFFNNYKNGSGFFYRLITYISLISYSLYLTNLTLVQTFIIPFLDAHLFNWVMGENEMKMINLILFFTVTFILSTYLYNFVEKPIMKARRFIKF